MAARALGELAAGLCGPPADFFLLGRHDLADVVRPLLDVLHRAAPARAVLSALIVVGLRRHRPGRCWRPTPPRWRRSTRRARRPTGLGGLMRWLASAWRGDFAASVVVCVEAAATSGCARRRGTCSSASPCSTTSASPTPPPTTYGLVPRALEVASAHRRRADPGVVPARRGLGARRPRSRPVGRPRAAGPRRHRGRSRARPGSRCPAAPRGCCRASTRRSPPQALLEQLAATPTRRSYVDMIPLFYGAALLERLGHPAAAPALGTVAAHRPAGAGSMMDFVDQARRASSSATPCRCGRWRPRCVAGSPRSLGSTWPSRLEPAGA